MTSGAVGFGKLSPLRYQKTMWFDGYENPSYLDSLEFATFCKSVREAITEKSGIGDIRRAMGDKFDERRIWDALGALVAVGELQECWGLPSKWEPSTPKPKKKYPRGTVSMGKPSDKSQPYASALYGDKSRSF